MAGFPVPKGGEVEFAWDDVRRSYAHRRGPVEVRLEFAANGVRGTVAAFAVRASVGHPDREEEVTTVSATVRDLKSFKRTFQEMVALDHDGGPGRSETSWGDEARWIALSRWMVALEGGWRIA